MAIAFKIFAPFEWAMGGCILSVMLYMWVSRPTTTSPLLSGAMAGLISLTTGQWSGKVRVRVREFGGTGEGVWGLG